MKKIRNIKPGQRKRERREAQAGLKRRMTAFLDHDKECCVCKTEFERNLETVKTWHVVVNEDRVRLTCPKCWGIIEKTLENKK